MNLIGLENGTSDRNLCDALGTIEVKVFPTKCLGPDPHYTPSFNTKLEYSIDSIHILKIHGTKYPLPLERQIG